MGTGPLGMGILPNLRGTDRQETIQRIKTGLRMRSGKSWSVTGGRGTAYGWIRIHSPPNRRLEFGYMTPADRDELTKLLNLPQRVHQQGESIPSGSAYYDEYVARAEGRTPERYGTPYWD